MHRILFEIGDLTVYTYGFCIALGLIGAVLLFWLLSKKFKLGEKSFNFYSTAVLISIVIGFLFAILFQAVYDWIESGFKKFTLLETGMTFMGGLIGGVGVFLLITAFFAKPDVKKDFWKTANLMAPCIPLAHGFGRIGCFFGGCCYGKVSDSPIAMIFPGITTQPVLPTQLFEAAFLFILTAVLLVLLFKFKRIDLQLITYLGAYAVWRFIIEYFRGDHRGSFIPGLTPSQFQSILMLFAAAALAFYIFYFDRVPFYGKQKVGRKFRFIALEEVGAPASETEIESGETAGDADGEGFDTEDGLDEKSEPASTQNIESGDNPTCK